MCDYKHYKNIDYKCEVNVSCTHCNRAVLPLFWALSTHHHSKYRVDQSRQHFSVFFTPNLDNSNKHLPYNSALFRAAFNQCLLLTKLFKKGSLTASYSFSLSSFLKQHIGLEVLIRRSVADTSISSIVSYRHKYRCLQLPLDIHQIVINKCYRRNNACEWVSCLSLVRAIC